MPPPPEPSSRTLCQRQQILRPGNLSLSREIQLMCTNPAPDREPMLETVSDPEPPPLQLLKAGTNWAVRFSK